MIYKDHEKLQSFTGTIPASSQTKKGSSVILKNDSFGIRPGTIFEVIGFDSDDRCIFFRTSDDRMKCMHISYFAALPVEPEKTFDSLTLDEVANRTVEHRGTGTICKMKVHLVIARNDSGIIFESMSLDAIKSKYILLPKGFTKIISRAEAEKLLAEKGVEVRIE